MKCYFNYWDKLSSYKCAMWTNNGDKDHGKKFLTINEMRTIQLANESER